jgi:hypothetical protein
VSDLTPYDGDLDFGKQVAESLRYVTEHQTGYANGEPGDRCWEVLLGPLDPPTWDNLSEWGRGATSDEAWRMVLAALLEPPPEAPDEPGTDPVTPELAAG